MTLTPDQEQAISYIETKLLKENQQYVFLQGYAGTGKTTCIREFCNRHKTMSLVLAAPTHKALHVLIRSVDMPIQADTIHSLLGVAPDFENSEYAIKNAIFTAKSKHKVTPDSILIIDEASMISEVLCALIKDIVNITHSKVIFMGDPDQIPPINEKSSRTLMVKNIFKLTKVIRQEHDNPILDMLTKIRNGETFEFLPCNNFTEDGRGYSIIADKKKWTSLVESTFTTKDKYIAWSNKAVNKFNKDIRKFQGRGKEIEIGEVLTCYKSYEDYCSECSIVDSNCVIKAAPTARKYHNSVDYEVKYTGSAVLQGKQKSVPVKILDLERIYDSNLSTTHILTESNTEFQEGILPLLLEHHNVAMDKTTAAFSRKKAWESYYKILSILPPFFNINDKWKPIVQRYWNFGYGITAHKSQGSTYENVYVDVKDILTCRNENEKYNLIYTALSRASKRLYIYA